METIEINKNQFENLCSLQCTIIEIAHWFNCSEIDIEDWCQNEYKMCFKEVYGHKRIKGLIALRKSQFKLAEVNTGMSIWMGKQYLGQKDNIKDEQ